MKFFREGLFLKQNLQKNRGASSVYVLTEVPPSTRPQNIKQEPRPYRARLRLIVPRTKNWRFPVRTTITSTQYVIF